MVFDVTLYSDNILPRYSDNFVEAMKIRHCQLLPLITVDFEKTQPRIYRNMSALIKEKNFFVWRKQTLVPGLQMWLGNLLGVVAYLWLHHPAVQSGQR